ncbi:MAG TPA: helix-turn-helix domain-containing protein, partial [Desulfosarcina sp.]|nr:helix-turn-helix domain-containing protein [Desulfosarcina sp.]
MKPVDETARSDDYRRIAKAIGYIESRFEGRPNLDEIAAHVNLSRFHFDRLFKRWAGISPMRFLHFLTLDHTKRQLAQSKSLLDASLESGLSGPGRLHDLFVTFDAMTPGAFKRRGAGLTIRYASHPSPFGNCLIALTERGICHLGFMELCGRPEAAAQLAQLWPEAVLVEDWSAVQPVAERIFAARPPDALRPFHLHLKGTNFQVNVWRALL